MDLREEGPFFHSYHVLWTRPFVMKMTSVSCTNTYTQRRHRALIPLPSVTAVSERKGVLRLWTPKEEGRPCFPSIPCIVDALSGSYIMTSLPCVNTYTQRMRVVAVPLPSVKVVSERKGVVRLWT